MPWNPLKMLLPTAINRLGAAKEVQAAFVIKAAQEALEEVLGASVAKGAKATSFRDKTINIQTKNAIITQEIQMRQRQLIARVNKKTNAKLVFKIRFSR